MSERVEHLQLVQSVISRLAGNSAQLKTWCVTIAAAIFVLSGKDANLQFAWVALVPVLVFWALDAHYLHLERQYRALYDAVRLAPEKHQDFDLDASHFKAGGLRKTLLSKTLLPFYGALSASTALIIVVFK